MIAQIQLSPGDERYIYVKWSKTLACEKALISLSNWSIPSGLIKLDDGILLWDYDDPVLVPSQGNATRIKVRGLEYGQTYELKNTITLDNGSILNGFLQIVCEKLSGEVSDCQ